MLHKSQKLLWLCLFFILGIFCTQWWHPLLFFLVIFLGIFKNFKFIFILCCALSFYLGIFYFQQAQLEPNPYLGQEVIWQGVIIREPDIRQNYVNYILHSDSFKELVQVRADLYPRYQYGDVLEISGFLEAPANSSDFAYDQYLARYGINTLSNYPQIKFLAAGQGNIFLAKIYQFKNYCHQRLNLIFISPVAEFMSGLILGLKKELPSTISGYFKTTGTIHILVISGLHILIISSVVSQGLKYLFIPRPKQIYFMLLVLGLFVIFTGAAPSVIRASLMALALLLAEKVGRPKATFNILILVATLMLLQNPLILLYDLGFQLSFLATIGLIYFSRPLEKILFFIPKFIRSLLAASLSAMALTNPLIMYQFKTFSVIAPLANLLIVPFIPIIMSTGLLILFLSFISLDAAIILGWGLTLLVEFIINLARYLSEFSWSQISL